MCIPSGDGLKQLAARIMGCSSGGQAQRLLAAAFHRAGSYTGHKSHWTQRSRQPANCFIDSTEANLLSVRGGGKKAPTYLRKFIGEETKRQVSVSSSHLVNRFFIYRRRFTCGICDDSFIPSLNQTIRKCVCFTR